MIAFHGAVDSGGHRARPLCKGEFGGSFRIPLKALRCLTWPFIRAGSVWLSYQPLLQQEGCSHQTLRRASRTLCLWGKQVGQLFQGASGVLFSCRRNGLWCTWHCSKTVTRLAFFFFFCCFFGAFFWALFCFVLVKCSQQDRIKRKLSFLFPTWPFIHQPYQRVLSLMRLRQSPSTVALLFDMCSGCP